MKLDAKDISAIANSRVNRLEGNKQMYWIVGVCVAMLAGVYMVQREINWGYALALVAFVAFMFNMNQVSKKQKRMKDILMKEWQDEGNG
jgi:hypothetical protein